MRYVRVIAALALVLTTLGLSHSSEAATGEQYFPQTGHSVVGIFLSYWQQSGCLAEQGGIIKAYHINTGDLETLAAGLSLKAQTYANPGFNDVSPRPVGQNGIAFMVYGLHGYNSLYVASLK